MKNRTILHYTVTLLIVALLLLPLLIHFVHLWQMENSYHASGVSFKQTSLEQARRTLEQQGINTAMPGSGSKTLTFTAPIGMTRSSFGDKSIQYLFRPARSGGAK